MGIAGEQCEKNLMGVGREGMNQNWERESDLGKRESTEIVYKEQLKAMRVVVSP